MNENQTHDHDGHQHQVSGGEELRDIAEVANERKLCLRDYEAKLDAISRVQGKPVPKPAIKPKK